MKTLAFALALAVSLPAAGLAVAHPGGHEDDWREIATPGQIRTVALGTVDTMITRGIIELSWRGLQPVSTTSRTQGGLVEWVILFENPKAKDPAKRKLYVFTNRYGDYLAANHTGE